ncbi:MAG: hypothetical protein J6D44_00505 [Pseudomonas sp.]|nr:hypothetical protein [Pseudomonas sp.]
MTSWVKVSRKLLTSAIASKPDYLAVWMHLMLSASYKAGEVLVGHQIIKLEAGDLVFGRLKFSQQIGVSEHTLRMALKTLEKLQQITIKSHSKFSVISITNWQKYQVDSPADHQQPTSNQPATHHNKEVQEIQEVDQKPPPTPKGKRLKADVVEFELPGWIDREAWEGFAAMRKSIKKPMTQRAMDLAVKALAKLAEMGHAPAAVLNQSTLHSWIGLFEVKNATGQSNTRGNSAGKPSLSEQVRQRNAERQAQRDREAGQGAQDSGELFATRMEDGGRDFEGEFSRISDTDGKIMGTDDRSVRP